MIRLTGGQFRGRSIAIPARTELRPSLSKLRQALFNTLQLHTEGARVLDLFAGSGALGFEALSRGAAHATFVDVSRDAERTIRKNAETLGVTENVHVICGDATRVDLPTAAFDLIFADPPYEKGLELPILARALNWTQPGALLIIESSAHDAPLPEATEGWACIRTRDYGDTRLTHYERV